MRKGLRFLVVSTIVSMGAHALADTLTVGVKGGADYTDIQSAIDDAADGDAVLVEPGEYVITEPIDFKGKKITVEGEAGAKLTTIIMSKNPTDPYRASVVTFQSGEGADSHLAGFTLTGGQGTGAPGSAPCGGGVYCLNSSPTLTDCTITRNSAREWFTRSYGYSSVQYTEGYGGGVSCENGSPILTGCTISGNSATTGGGLCSRGSSPHLTSCLIWGNSATGFSTYVTRYRTTTQATGMGGGTYLGGGSPTLINCTITGNSSDSLGGVGGEKKSSAMLTNCIVWGNTPESICGTRIQCLTNKNPLFVDPAGGDFHLQPRSPAIDTGTSIGAPATDIEGYRRPCGKGFDIGAYEYGNCQ